MFAATDHPAARSLGLEPLGSGHSRAGEPRRSQPRGAAVHGRTDAAGLVPPEPRRAARGQGVAARRPPSACNWSGPRASPNSFPPCRPRDRLTWLDQAQHGSGLNRMIEYLMLKHAFDNLRMVRVQLSTAASNLRAQGAIEARRAARGRTAQPPAAGRRAARRHLRLQHHRPRMAAGQGGAGSQLHRLKPVPSFCGKLGPSDGRTRRRQCRTRTSGEHTRISFWRAAELGGVELLHARYVEQRFAPHVHSSFALVIIEQGAQRFRHRGGEHLAPLGHGADQPRRSAHRLQAHDAGWLYRGYYPEMEQIDGILDELEIHHGGVPRFADSVIHDQPLARAFVHLHRLLAEHAGSLETRPLARDDARPVPSPRPPARSAEGRAGAVGGGPRPRTAGGAVARSAFAGGTGGGGQSVPVPFCPGLPSRHRHAAPRLAQTAPPGAGQGTAQRAAGRRWRWPWSWASPTRATSVASSSRPTGWHRVNTARPARARP